MYLVRKTINKLNKITAKYSGWRLPEEIQKMYEELEAAGIIVPAWGYWDRENAHPYEFNGEEVENSYFVFSKYEDPNSSKNEYNIYFS